MQTEDILLLGAVVVGAFFFVSYKPATAVVSTATTPQQQVPGEQITAMTPLSAATQASIASQWFPSGYPTAAATTTPLSTGIPYPTPSVSSNPLIISDSWGS
jgi:hypothetical protein